MSKLHDQLKRIVKKSDFLQEDLKENEDRDLTLIDKSLDEAVDQKVNETLKSILGEK